jgi:hypothetical protein
MKGWRPSAWHRARKPDRALFRRRILAGRSQRSAVFPGPRGDGDEDDKVRLLRAIRLAALKSDKRRRKRPRFEKRRQPFTCFQRSEEPETKTAATMKELETNQGLGRWREGPRKKPLIALVVGCDRFIGGPRAGLASWPCLSRPSTRFGASSARKLATEAKNLCICRLLQRAAPMPDSYLRAAAWMAGTSPAMTRGFGDAIGN